jgi:TolB-like protein/cytochrome c-type biogenesis protein CcmH/NrfG
MSEPPAKSIAVLPFVNMSNDLAQEHFSDGMSEELLHRLAQISELHVAARTSSFHFKNKNIPVAEIAAQLGVESVLEGSVRRAGNTIRVTAQLIKVSDGFHIWSKTYEREFDDIFAIQDEIASNVVSALKVTLLGEEQARLNRHPTDNLAAYNAYLLGRQKMARRTSAALQEAVGHFSEAIKLDSQYALAYVGLADSFALLGQYGALDDREVIVKAMPAVERALELNDQLGEAYVSLGTVRFRQHDYVGAEQAYKTALLLSPNYAPAYHGYGMLLNWGFSRPAEALELNQMALSLDPLSTPINMAVVEGYHELGRFEDVLAQCQRIIEIDPDYPRTYTIMGDLYWEVFAQLDESVRWLHRAVELDPGNPDHARWLGMVYLDLGDLVAGEYWMREAMRLAPTQSDSIWAAVHLARYRNDSEEIIAAAKELLGVWPNNLLSLVLLRDYDYQAGRGDAAFQRFRAAQPDLFDAADPKVNANTWQFAIEIANILTKVGQRERADILLNEALLVIEAMPRLGYRGFGISDVEIYALLGDKEKALSTFATAVEEGWRFSWRINTETNYNLNSLHDDPRYQAIVLDIQTKMAKQLAQVREWEADGELVTVPRLSD